jgi:hypothetical protein
MAPAFRNSSELNGSPGILFADSLLVEKMAHTGILIGHTIPETRRIGLHFARYLKAMSNINSIWNASLKE